MLAASLTQGTRCLLGRIAPTLLGLALIFPFSQSVNAIGGSVVAWSSFGPTYQGTATNVPSGLSNVVAVSAGLDDALALRADGSVVAWGAGDFGITNVPLSLSNVVAISSGWLYHMALKGDGTVFTWGHPSTAVPAGLTNVVAIAAGGHQFCLALLKDKSVVAWGYNGSGQTNIPAGLTDVIAIAAGLDHSVALRSDGTVVAWGDSTFQATNVPPNLDSVVAIAAGWDQTLALRADGTVVGWGNDAYVPPGLTNAVAVAAGWDAGQEFLLDDGTLVDWPHGLTNAVAIARGHFFALAVVVSNEPAFTLGVPVNSPAWDGGQFSVSVPTRNGRVYGMQYKRLLTDSHWTRLPLAAGNGEIQRLRDFQASDPHRFYRVLKW